MVISTVNQVIYNGDGTTTAWPYTFRIIDATDIKLAIIDADETETEITSDYYVDTVNDTVYYPGYAPGAEPPAEDQPPVLPAGKRLLIYRQLPITQEKDLGEKWPFEVIELALDKLTMILQQVYDWWNRCLKISPVAQAEHPNFDMTFPIEAGKSFRVNAAGTGFEVSDDPGISAAAAIEAATIASAAAEAAAAAAAATELQAVWVDNVAALRSANLPLETTAGTKGQYSTYDGGSAIYNIRERDVSDVDDGINIIFLDNGYTAERIPTLTDTDLVDAEERIVDEVQEESAKAFAGVYDSRIGSVKYEAPLTSSTYYTDDYWLQSACYNSDDNVYLFIAHERTGTYAKLITVDADSFAVISTNTVSIGHGNDCTYNPNTKNYYVVDGTENSPYIYIIDAATLTVTETITVDIDAADELIAQISYDAANDRYFITTWTKIYTLDSTLSELTYICPRYAKPQDASIKYFYIQGSCMIGSWFVSGVWFGNYENYSNSFTRLYFIDAEKGVSFYRDVYSQAYADELEGVCEDGKGGYWLLGQLGSQITRIHFLTNNESDDVVTIPNIDYVAVSQIPLNAVGYGGLYSDTFPYVTAGTYAKGDIFRIGDETNSKLIFFHNDDICIRTCRNGTWGAWTGVTRSFAGSNSWTANGPNKYIDMGSYILLNISLEGGTNTAGTTVVTGLPSIPSARVFAGVYAKLVSDKRQPSATGSIRYTTDGKILVEAPGEAAMIHCNLVIIR